MTSTEALDNPKEALNNPEEALDKPREALDNPKEALDNLKEALDNPSEVQDNSSVALDNSTEAQDSPRQALDIPREAQDNPREAYEVHCALLVLYIAISIVFDKELQKSSLKVQISNIGRDQQCSKCNYIVNFNPRIKSLYMFWHLQNEIYSMVSLI